MSDIILHHYPPSPVSEKIRTVFGVKRLAWKSVEQNRLPERPELFAMTGGYRRIPVMQIGADIYCDTQMIFRELELRYPQPSLHPACGNAFGLSRWVDDEFFKLGVRLAFAPVHDTLPAALVNDRTRLYFGTEGDMQAEARDIPHTLSQIRAQLGWVEDQLEASDKAFLGADTAGMEDILIWHLVWFVRGRYSEQTSLFTEFPKLVAWADRMAAIGHGTHQDMSTSEALAVAKAASPETSEQPDAHDKQELKPGMRVSVAPLTDSGEQGVEGKVLALLRNSIAISRSHELCGEVAVHFPRVGYRVSIVE